MAHMLSFAKHCFVIQLLQDWEVHNSTDCAHGYNRHDFPMRSRVDTDKKENKIFLIQYIRKFRGIGCRVIFD
jgi:hypothetical protein